MSQYSTRIYIKVKSKEDWKKASRLKLEKYGLWDDALKELDGNEFCIDGDWSCDEWDLNELVKKISSKIPECIICADTNNYNVDPYNYAIFSVEKKIMTNSTSGSEGYQAEIDNPIAWCKANKHRLTKELKETLKEYGIK